MKPDRTTYEAWLLDRIEGRLTPEQERELAAFLLANPDLDPGELDELPRVEAEEIPGPDKDRLKHVLPPRGMPDRRSLDLFLVARLEGDLSAEQEAALTALLKEHPELDLEARRMAAARVPSDPLSRPTGLELHRTLPPAGMPDRHRITEFLIAAEEGDLDAGQRKALEALVAGDPDLERERCQVRAARVRPEPLVFADKGALRKGGRVIGLWSRTVARLSVAASIALLLGLGWTLLQQDPGMDQELVEAVRTDPSDGTGPADQGAVPAPVTASQGTQGQAEVEQNDSDGPGAASEAVTSPVEGPSPERTLDRPVDRPAPRELPTRLEPMLADAGGAEERSAPADVPVEEVPMLAEAPDAGAVKQATPSYTPGELLAATVRGRVLEERDPDTRPLDAKDAVAMADKGLGAISGGKAGLEVDRREGRRRFSLRLGSDLAITASSGR